MKTVKSDASNKSNHIINTDVSISEGTFDKMLSTAKVDDEIEI